MKIEKKKKKSQPRLENDATHTKEMKRYLGALNEMHGEHLQGIRENFDFVNKNINEIKETLDSHTKTLDSHTKILDSHTETLASHTEMIGILMEDVSSIKGDLKKKVDYDDFLSLVKRVQKIEAKI
jgi:chromosome segregation ATPase